MAANKPKRPARKGSKPQNISKMKGQWGGPRPNSGGSRSGSGRPQRKPLPYPKDIDLMEIRDFDYLLCDLIEKYWKSNPMDSRTLGALNTTFKMLMDLRSWNADSVPNTGYIRYFDEEDEPTEEKESNDEENLDPDEVVTDFINQVQDEGLRDKLMAFHKKSEVKD